MASQNTGDHDRAIVKRTSPQPTLQLCRNHCGLRPGLRVCCGKRRTHRFCSSEFSLPRTCFFFVSVTSSATNLGSARAHRHWGTISGSVPLFHLPFFSLLCSSNDKLWISRSSCVMTAANYETLRFGVSCASDGSTTNSFLAILSSAFLFKTSARCLVTMR